MHHTTTSIIITITSTATVIVVILVISIIMDGTFNFPNTSVCVRADTLLLVMNPESDIQRRTSPPRLQSTTTRLPFFDVTLARITYTHTYRWWETGTQYAFQPRLAAKPSTTISKRMASPQHGKRGSNDVCANSGGEGNGSHTHQGRQGRGWGRDDEAGVCRVAQPVEGHPGRGTRVFFVV